MLININTNLYNESTDNVFSYINQINNNYNAIIEAARISELRYYQDTGKELFINETNILVSLIHRIVEFFKNLLNKIISLFKRNNNTADKEVKKKKQEAEKVIKEIEKKEDKINNTDNNSKNIKSQPSNNSKSNQSNSNKNKRKINGVKSGNYNNKNNTGNNMTEDPFMDAEVVEDLEDYFFEPEEENDEYNLDNDFDYDKNRNDLISGTNEIEDIKYASKITLQFKSYSNYDSFDNFLYYDMEDEVYNNAKLKSFINMYYSLWSEEDKMTLDNINNRKNYYYDRTPKLRIDSGINLNHPPIQTAETVLKSMFCPPINPYHLNYSVLVENPSKFKKMLEEELLGKKILRSLEVDRITLNQLKEDCEDVVKEYERKINSIRSYQQKLMNELQKIIKDLNKKEKDIKSGKLNISDETVIKCLSNYTEATKIINSIVILFYSFITETLLEKISEPIYILKLYNIELTRIINNS